MKTDYDVIILGSGPAGFSCAMQSSKFGKKVLIVEANEDFLGGTWINTGTVPSKALRETARIIKRFQKQFPSEDKIKPYQKYKMEDLLKYKANILKSKNSKVEHDLVKNEVDTIRGFGYIKSNSEVEVTNSAGEKKLFTTKNILIATGSRPVKPTNFTVDGKKILGYSSILNLTHIPHRLVIVGSGVNALEYSTTFASLGSRVSILSDQNEFLPFLDHEIKEQLNIILEKLKIETTTNVKNVEVIDNSLRNTTEVKYQIEGDKESRRSYVIETEHILYLGGKIPNTDAIGIKKLKVDTTEDGHLLVDSDYHTNIANIYAAGDVIGFPALASASFAQGRIAACHMFGVKTESSLYQIPFAIYSIPEIANIGFTEHEARDKGFNVNVGRAYYNSITQGDVSNQQDGMLKLVFDNDSYKLLGIHIIGERASDLIHLGQAVMCLGGDIFYFIDHVLNYPTYSEAYRIAAFNGINRVHEAGVKYKKILKRKTN